MPTINGAQVLLAVIAATALWYIRRWWLLERGRGQTLPLRPAALAVSFGTNFFDTLGIGSFAPTTAIFKLQRRMPDDEIPGTLNVGQAPYIVPHASHYPRLRRDGCRDELPF
jgi:hypothetical protein